MNEKSTSEFKISLDDAIVDTDITEKPKKKPGIDKKKQGGGSGRSLPPIVIVLIVLIGVAMIAGYVDIRNRLLSFHSSGSQETRHLSEDLQFKFSTLSDKFSTMEGTINGLTDSGKALSGAVSSLDEAMKKADKSIAGIKSSMADKKSLDEALKGIEKQVSPLSETLKQTAADTAVMSAKLNASITEMSTASAKISDDIKALKLVAETLQADKASKKDLLTEIDHIENVLKTSKNQNEKQAAELTTSIRRLDLRIRSLEIKAGITPPPNNQAEESKPAAVEPGGQTPVSPSPSIAPPGDVIERDITQ